MIGISGPIRTLYRSLGDLCTRFALAKILVDNLKTKLGVIPDFKAELEGTVNTSLAYHGGEEFNRHWLSVLHLQYTTGSTDRDGFDGG